MMKMCEGTKEHIKEAGRTVNEGMNPESTVGKRHGSLLETCSKEKGHLCHLRLPCPEIGIFVEMDAGNVVG